MDDPAKTKVWRLQALLHGTVIPPQDHGNSDVTAAGSRVEVIDVSRLVVSVYCNRTIFVVVVVSYSGVLAAAVAIVSVASLSLSSRVALVLFTTQFCL